MKCLKSSALVTFAALGLVAMAQSASAQTYSLKEVSAVNCRLSNGLTTPMDATRGYVKNISYSYAKNIVCPLERYNPLAAPSFVKVNVIDNSRHTTAGAVSCFVTRVNRYGTASSNGATSSTALVGIDATGETLDLAVPALYTGTGAQTNYLLKCSIPKRLKTTTALDAPSLINSYEVWEEVTPAP